MLHKVEFSVNQEIFLFILADDVVAVLYLYWILVANSVVYIPLALVV